jgi:hypothetical protein
MSSPSRSLLPSSFVIALAALGGLAVACGGAERAPAQSAPSRAAPPPGQPELAPKEPETVEEAQAQIERARAELASGGASAEPASPTADTPLAPAAPPTRPSTPPAKSSAVTEEPGGGACQSPCRAIASMRRAVTALCRMTGDTDARCEGAKRTLADSEQKLARCSC